MTRPVLRRGGSRGKRPLQPLLLCRAQVNLQSSIPSGVLGPSLPQLQSPALPPSWEVHTNPNPTRAGLGEENQTPVPRVLQHGLRNKASRERKHCVRGPPGAPKGSLWDSQPDP